MTPRTVEKETLISLTADIVSAHVAHNTVATNDVAKLIQNVFGALEAAGDQNTDEEERVPAVSIRSSVKKDHIVSYVFIRRLHFIFFTNWR